MQGQPTAILSYTHGWFQDIGYCFFFLQNKNANSTRMRVDYNVDGLYIEQVDSCYKAVYWQVSVTCGCKSKINGIICDRVRNGAFLRKKFNIELLVP